MTQKFTAEESERFWSNVNAGPGCWEWTKGKTRGKQGYGIFCIRGRRLVASRVSYELTNGDFDKRLFVCHHCDNPACIRPDHLFLGTQKDNMRDAMKKHRVIPPGTRPGYVAWNAHPEVCKNGHEMSGHNIGITKRGKRYCRECLRLSSFRVRQRQKASIRAALTEDKPT